MKLQAIIYDFDGVLAESVSVKDDAFLSIFQEFGDKFASDMLAYHKAMNTDRYLTIKEAGRRLDRIDEKFLSDKAVEFANQVQQRVIEAPDVKGARILLQYCCDQNIKQFVSSGAPEIELQKIIKARHMDHYFNQICGIPRRKIEHIDSFKTDYNLNFEECLFIGDTMLDYQAAIERNIAFVGRSAKLRFPAPCPVVEDMFGLLHFLQDGLDPAELILERTEELKR